MAHHPEHARRMRRAYEKSDRIVQIGIQVTSAPGYATIKEMITPEKMGEITALHTHFFRNRRYGGWMREIPPDCDPEHVDWAGFEGEATHYEFDPLRLMCWRFFWDYDGGDVYECMVHQVGFWYKLMDMKIPDSVTMTGANIRSPKMQVPDTMDVCMMQGNVMFTWNSMFGNDLYGEGHDMLLGTKGTITRNESDQVRYQPQGQSRLRGIDTITAVPPIGGQEGGYYEATNQHMQNFFDCMRSRKEPNCSFEIGYRSAIACQMANASYRLKRTVTWDSKTEDIV
jgi:predicted dehydrogenase